MRWFPISGRMKFGKCFEDRDPTLKVVLAIDPPHVREQLAAHYGHDRLMTIIAPAAFVSPTAGVGRGSIVQRGVLVGRNTRLGTAVKLNCGARSIMTPPWAISRPSRLAQEFSGMFGSEPAVTSGRRRSFCRASGSETMPSSARAPWSLATLASALWSRVFRPARSACPLPGKR